MNAAQRAGLMFAVLGSGIAGVAHADRISEMTREERCVYTAKLQVAAAWHFSQGRSRESLKIHWHGDETQNEIEFVNRTIDAGYAAMIRESGKGTAPPPVEIIGDQAYVACMKESTL